MKIFIIKNTQGKVLLQYSGWSEGEAIATILSRVNSPFSITWDMLKSVGYECIQYELKEKSDE